MFMMMMMMMVVFKHSIGSADCNDRKVVEFFFFFSFLCLQVQYKGASFCVSVTHISLMEVNNGFEKKNMGILEEKC